MTLSFSKLAGLIWLLFFAYWYLSAAFNKTNPERHESNLSRLFYIVLIGLAVFLFSFGPAMDGPLLWRFVPEGMFDKLLGLAILISGLCFAIWARLHLGRYWSGRISLAENHQLIQTGPYRLVRNPIYCGGLIAVLGTAIIIGEARAIPAFILVLIALLYKINQEEKLLKERFAREFTDYQKEVKSLIPFIY